MTDLYAEYSVRLPALRQVAGRLEDYVTRLLEEVSRVENVHGRAKSLDRFIAKAEKTSGSGTKKYTDPLLQFQDQIGVRVITYYLSDVQPIRDTLLRYLRPIEDQRHVPDDTNEFGYEGHHLILLMPSDVTLDEIDRQIIPEFFELQIQTLFQHAWAEAEHDLGYKPYTPLNPDQMRRIAFTAAQAWWADQIFDELHRQTSQPRSEQ